MSKIKVLQDGDDTKVGAVEYQLSEDGAGLIRQLVTVERKTFTLGGLTAAKKQHEAALATIDALLAEYAELSQ